MGTIACPWTALALGRAIACRLLELSRPQTPIPGMKMKATNRRELLKTTAITAAATFAAPAFVRGQNLNDKIRVAIVGMGGRASAHAESLVELEKESTAGVELAGVCDCDEAKRKSAEKVWGERSGHAIKTYDDMRRVLDDPVDRCGDLRDAESLAFAERDLGMPGRQRRVRRKARIPQHLRGPQDG